METIELLKQENEALKAQIEDLYRKAYIDSLTGINSRLSFDMKFDSLWELAKRKRRTSPIAIILLDLDHLKQINDTKGHIAGDDAIKDIASILESRCRKSDVVSRWGGDEFAIIMPNSDTSAASILSEDLLALINKAGYSASIGISSGIPTSPFVKGVDTKEELLNSADKALYVAKNQRNCAIAL